MDECGPKTSESQARNWEGQAATNLYYKIPQEVQELAVLTSGS